MLSDITEEQAAEIVDKERFIVDGPDLGFRNYIGNKYDWFGTALESLHSAIKADGWYIGENPYAKSLKDAVEKSPRDDYKTKLSEANIFREAQSRVLCRERCLVLRRVDL